MFKKIRQGFFTKAFLPPISLLIALTFFYGCATTPVQKPIQKINAPKWVIKGSGAFDSDSAKVFYGVGSAVGINNSSLLRTTAENRARNEIAKIFEVYVSSLMKDYSASTADMNAQKTTEEQHVEQAIKTLTSQTLSGARIVDYWQDPKTGEMFTLAKLDLEAFEDLIGEANQLNNKAREYIKERAKALHEELSREVDKLQDNSN